MGKKRSLMSRKLCLSLEQCSEHLLVHSSLTGSEFTIARKIQRKGKRRIKKTHTDNYDHILTLVPYTVFVFCFLGLFDCFPC